MQMMALALPIMGGLISGAGEIRAGQAAKQSADFQAEQMRRNADATESASQRAAAGELRKSQFIQSRALAVAGASGGGVLDPTVLNLVSGIAGEGALAAETELYNGRVNAQGMRTQAMATAYEGLQRKRASKIGALTSVIGGVSSGMGNWFGAANYNYLARGTGAAMPAKITAPSAPNNAFNSYSASTFNT
jgi:hypothetical protein